MFSYGACTELGKRCVHLYAALLAHAEEAGEIDGRRFATTLAQYPGALQQLPLRRILLVNVLSKSEGLQAACATFGYILAPLEVLASIERGSNIARALEERIRHNRKERRGGGRTFTTWYQKSLCCSLLFPPHSKGTDTRPSLHFGHRAR